jgi:hypothetical protein
MTYIVQFLIYYLEQLFYHARVVTICLMNFNSLTLDSISKLRGYQGLCLHFGKYMHVVLVRDRKIWKKKGTYWLLENGQTNFTCNRFK